MIGYRFFYRRKGASGFIEAKKLVDDTDFEVIGLSRMVSGGNRTFQFYIIAVDKMNNESERSNTLENDLPL